MDNHSLRSPKDEGHRGYAAIDQRYGEKTRYHAVRRASPREPIKTLQKVVDVRVWARNELPEIHL